ncbi:MAG: hypothetical protein OXF11_01815, partial [Deltaproteobacteria bacterium]|nr:hypothetical protein [Deltaproteobacteria bacterium]
MAVLLALAALLVWPETGWAQKEKVAGPVAAPLNSPAEGSVLISGSPKVGNIMTANASSVRDPDGMNPLNYQWYAAASEDGPDGIITGATSRTYTISQAQLGKHLRVQVAFLDNELNFEEVWSDRTVAVLARGVANQRPTSQHNLNILTAAMAQTSRSDVRVGDHLSVEILTVHDPDGLGNFEAVRGRADHYSWLADDLPIAGAQGTSIQLTGAHAGKRIKSRFTFTDSDGEREYVTIPAGSGPVRHRVAATGEPEVTGHARVGDTLTATTTGIVEPDGIDATSLSYVWLADAAAIAGATSSTYTLTANELNKRIGVRVSFTDGAGDSEVLASRQVGPVRAAGTQNQPATGTVTVRGALRPAGILTAVTDGVSDADGLSQVRFKFQWLADNTAVSGATGRTHTLTESDLGKRFSVRVSFADDGGSAETITSAPTGPVMRGSPPTGRPAIGGFVQVGQTLRAITGEIDDRDGLDRMTFLYQWLADDVPIANAMSATYTLTAAEQGKRITLRVTFTDGAGIVEALTSVARGPVREAGVQNQAPTGVPAISGTVRVGYTLRADTTDIGDADGFTDRQFLYQWLADGSVLEGETGTAYLVKASDAGRSLTVRVVFTDDLGTVETLTSAATAAVPNDMPNEGDVRISGAFLLFFLDGEWGYVCGYSGSRFRQEAELAAQVACRQLGRGGGGYRPPNAVPPSGLDPAIEELDCSGTENTLSECSYTALNRCDGSDAIGVICTDDTGPGLDRYAVITGDVRVGEVLTADFTVPEIDYGYVVRTDYQWFVDDLAVEGATAPTYPIRRNDRHKGIRVRVTTHFRDGFDPNHHDSLTTAAVAESGVDSVGFPEIDGLAEVGRTLKADTSGIWDPDGPTVLEFEYQWLADGTAISTATASTYTVMAGDVGKSLTVEVEYTDGAQNEMTLRSAGTPVVVPVSQEPVGRPEIEISLLVYVEGKDYIEGGRYDVVGETLTVDTTRISDPDGPAVLEFEYQWLADGIAISTATVSTYTVREEDAGKSLVVEVSYTDAKGNHTTLRSAGTLPVAPSNFPPSGSIEIRGRAEVGQTLTAYTGEVFDRDSHTDFGFALDFTFQWFAAGEAISTATASTYTVMSGDVGKRLTVEGRYTDEEGHSNTATSNETALVIEVENRAPAGLPVIGGTVALGQRLTVDTTGITDGDGPEELEFSYQWYSGGVAVSGRTLATYV